MEHEQFKLVTKVGISLAKVGEDFHVMICLLKDIDLAPLVLQLLCTCKCLGPKSDGAGKVGCERLKGWKDILYILYTWNLFVLYFGG